MKVLKVGKSANGVDIQIEEWHENYSFMPYGSKLAFYPESKATHKGQFAPKAGENEIEHNAIEISRKNYPDIVRGGDVTKEEFTKYKGKVDLLIGGSPCQNLCSCGDKKGLDGAESKLFFDYVRALYETEAKWFLLENNATMTKENQDIITEIMGVEPIYINSNLLTAQDRKRLYWTNIPGIEQPEDRGLTLKDIVQPVEEKKEYECYKRMAAKREGTLAFKKAWANVRTLDQKSRALTTSQSISNSGATNVKYSDTEYYILTPIECERLQTLPDDYTEGVSNTQRYKAVGNGWTVEVIAHIFKALRVALEKGAAPVMLKERVRPEQSYRNIEIMPEKMRQEAEEREVIKMQGQDKEKYEKQIAELKQLVKERDKEIADMREEMQQLKNKVFNILLEKACG